MPTAEFTVTSHDPSVPRRILGVEPQPDIARQIHNAAVIVYRGSDKDGAGRRRFGFLLEFATPNEAGVVANWMWSTLHGRVAALEIGGEEVPVQNAAIKRALLMHADNGEG